MCTMTFLMMLGSDIHHPTQLWNHQAKQEDALQGTLLTELENKGI